MKNALTTAALTVYVYAIVTLSQYGFSSYFYIPSNYIQTSIAGNIIAFYSFAYLSFDVLRQMPWYAWLSLIIIATVTGLVIVGAYATSKVYMYIIVVVAALLSLVGFYKFGWFLASNTEVLETLPSECLGLSDQYYYVTVLFNGEDALIAPVEKSTNKVNSTFLVRNLADLSCAVGYAKIGKVSR